MKLRVITIIIAFFVIIQSATAYKHEESKVIEKVFSCKEGVYLNISNKYGDITIKAWEKDQVKITATIVVYSKKDIDTERLDNIDIKFSNNSHNISAETRVIEKMKRPDYSYSITYQVLAPKYAQLDIGNYNGDIYIADCTGKITSNSKYGNLIFNKTNSPSININAYNGNIDIKNCGEKTGSIGIKNKYGNINVNGHYNSTNIDVYNGNIDIHNKSLDATQTRILSKYGHVRLNGYSKEIDIDVYNGNTNLGAETKAETTNIKSKYGNIVLSGQSRTIMIESYNGSIDVSNESIPGRVMISNKYGNIKYKGGFTMIVFNNYNGNVSLENTGNNKGEGGAINTQYGNIKYTGYAQNLVIINYNGNININNNTSSKVEDLTVKNAYGNVELNNVENIKILNATSDKYHIVNSKSIIIENGKYSSFNIDGLTDKIITNNQLKFVEFNVKNIDSNFKNINIFNSYSQISLSFLRTNDYKMNISGKFGGVKIADALKNSTIKITEDEDRSVYSAKQEGSAGSLIVDNQYGDIKLELEN